VARASKWLPVFSDFAKDIRIMSKEKTSKDDRGVPLILWESQKRFMTQLASGLDDGIRIFYWLKGRQLGITTLSLAIDIFWLATHPTIIGALVTDTEKNRTKNRATIRKYINSFPDGYFGDTFGIVKGQDNDSFMGFTNGARLDFLVAGTKKKSTAWAEGEGYAFAHLTECANYADAIGLASFEKSFSQANPDRLYLYESTAKGRNNVWFDRWIGAENDPYTRRSHFIGWWANPFNAIARHDPKFEKYGAAPRSAEEKHLIGQVRSLYDYDITPEQVAWYRWQEDTAVGEEAQTLPQDYPWTAEMAFIVSGFSFFAIRALNKAEKAIHDSPDDHRYTAYRYFYGDRFFDLRLEFLDPDECETPGELEDLKAQIELWVWEEPKENGRYVIGVDPAFGGDGDSDSCAISVWRCYADCMEQVAEYATNRVEPKRAAWVMAHLAGAYKDCVVNVELAGGGSNMMQEMDSLRQLLQADLYADVVRTRDWEDALGWARWYLYHRPDSPGKGFMYNTKIGYDIKRRMLYGYQGAFVTNELIIHSTKLINEMLDVRVMEDEIGAPNGQHDDRVTAAALACLAWNDPPTSRKVEMISLGLTRKRVMDETSGSASLMAQRANNLVYRFMQTLEQQAEEAKLAPLRTWREERGL
jgi:hypothetical protein